MNFNLNKIEKIVNLLTSIDWFSRCGFGLPTDMPFPVDQISTADDAVAMALGPAWQDARTEAQGDLTGYLAKHHADAYDHWNSLARSSRELIQIHVMPKIVARLEQISASSLTDTILLDLNRIALHCTYSKRFRRLPDFFSRLLTIYERGHLPCGWNGDLNFWPEGQLIVY